jgi:ComF family protein
MAKRLQRWGLAALDFLWPDVCLLCDQTLHQTRPLALCEHCEAALPRNEPSCRHCSLPLTSGDSDRCARCSNQPFPAHRAVVPLRHEAAAQHLVHQLKFHQGFREARCLGRIVADAVARAYCHDCLPALLVPVPLSYWNAVRRGYNQSFELASQIGKALDIRTTATLLARRHGPSQRHLGRSKRLALPHRTFRLRNRLDAAHIAIVDDVMTTGTTVKVLAHVLQQAGAGRVDVWCATRATLR